MDYITIIKGDDTNFLEDQFIVVNFKTDFDMSGFTATFSLGDVTLTYGNLTNKKFEIVLSSEITSNFVLGKQYGELKLIDTSNRTRTITSVIPFLVKNGVNEQITYINNSLNITTNINDTKIDIIVETAGIAKTEAENLLASCNEAMLVSVNSANTAQTMAVRMDNQVNAMNAKFNEIIDKTDTTLQTCEDTLVDINTAKEKAIISINNANDFVNENITSGINHLTTEKDNALASVDTAISQLEKVETDTIANISATQAKAIEDIENTAENKIAGIIQFEQNSENNSKKAAIWAEGSDEEVHALGGIHSSKKWAEFSAKGQVQADWSETDSSSVAFINNKPVNGVFFDEYNDETVIVDTIGDITYEEIN